MSFRVLPATDEAFREWMAEVADALDSLQRGGNLRGRISLGPEIQVGGMLIRVEQTGTTLALVAENTLTGGTQTIVTVP